MNKYVIVTLGQICSQHTQAFSNVQKPKLKKTNDILRMSKGASGMLL